MLVERCCGRAALGALASQLGPAWQAHANELYGTHAAQRSQAVSVCTDWQDAWRHAVASDLQSEARTRLGLDGIDLELPAHQTTPFGNRIDTLSVPAWMLPAAPAGEQAVAPVVEGLQAFDGGFRFSVRGQSLRYDRHGLAQDGPRRQ
jgi:CRISPR-associated endonuclease/helicase Cas3